MVPEGIKLPNDNTVASQGVRRNNSTPLETPERSLKTPSKPPPNPLATIVLQSKPIIEGRKGELFQLILQNDPKSDPPIKVNADTNIPPGTPLLVELDENGQYQPIDRLTRSQITKLITLELEFWQAHLYPKAASKTAPPLPAKETLLNLASRYPELKPLMQWLVQRPSQFSGQQIQQLIQEFSPLSSLRTSAPVQSSRTFNLTNLGAQHSEAGHRTGSQHVSSPGVMQNPANIQANSFIARQSQVTQTPSNSPLLTSTQTPIRKGEPFSNTIKPILTFKGRISTVQIGSSPTPQGFAKGPSMTISTPNSTLTETMASSVYRAKQLAPILGLVSKPVAPEHLSNLASLAQQPLSNSNSTQPILGSQQNSMLNKAEGSPLQASLLPSLPKPVGLANPADSAFKVFKQVSSEWLSGPRQTLTPASTATNRQMSDLIEVKLSQWINILEQTQTKSSAELAHLLKSKAMALLSEGQSAADKIQIDPKLMQQSAPKDDALNQVRSWLESAQAKVFHQAVQSASTQWQMPELPAVQQLQLPLIWLGLTSWADIEWWQEKKKKQSEHENAEKERRWRMRIYLKVAPLSEFCADIDWHVNDTQLIFWSEDSATLSHLNSLIPTLNSWTQGLSSESNIQTRRGMPNRVSKQQLKRTNHHLVDIKT